MLKFSMIIPLLTYCVIGTIIEDKENTCFFFVSSAMKLRIKEIEDILKQNASLNRKDIHLKITEDTFNHCIQKITEEEVSVIGLKRIRDFQPYLHLFNIKLSKYSGEDVKVSEEFLQKREEISKRISRGATSSGYL